MNYDRAVYASLMNLARELERNHDADLPSIYKWLSHHSQMSCLVIDSVLKPLFERWPKFSGDPKFPVPSGNPYDTHSMAYQDASRRWGGFWDRNTKYGAARRELLTFLIHNLLIKIHDDENRKVHNINL